MINIQCSTLNVQVLPSWPTVPQTANGGRQSSDKLRIKSGSCHILLKSLSGN
jgi:hypothetical protein